MANQERASPADAHLAAGRATTPSAPHLDLAELHRLLRKRWRLFRNVALTTIALALAVVFALPSSYSTSAVVMLEPRKNNVTDQSSVLSEVPTDPASIQNQIQLLTSRDLAARVVDKLGLVDDPEFGGGAASDPLRWFESAAANSPERRTDRVVNAFLKHLTVEENGLSTTISVTFSSRDPEKSALIANTVVDTYIEMQAAVKFDVTQRTTAWLLDRIHQLGQQVQLAEANVQRYRAENNLNDAPTGGSLVDQQLGTINTQLVEARANLAAKQAENERIASLMESGRAADVSQIISSPLIVQLREQQADAIRQISQLSTRYGPRNPKLITAEAQKRDLDAKIEQEVARLAGSAQNDLTVARAEVHSLETSLRQVESQSAVDNMARVKLQSLEANAASTRAAYETFVTRLREAQGQDVMQMTDARVISHAAVPLMPASPPRLLVSLASLPAGLLLGFLAILLAERLGAPVERAVPERAPPAPVSRDPLRGVPVLAQISGVFVARAADYAADQPASPFAQAMRTLAQRIMRSPAPKIVTVTSIYPQDGQTAVTINLARAAAQLGLRVLLVEGNLQAPTLGAAARLAAPQAGLLELLSGKARLSQALMRDPRSNALVLPVAQRYADSRGVWASSAMQRLMTHLRQVSDLVIVEAAPMSGAQELPFVARLSDALILVSAWSGTPQGDLGAALDHLEAIQAPPVGIVLTS